MVKVFGPSQSAGGAASERRKAAGCEAGLTLQIARAQFERALLIAQYANKNFPVGASFSYACAPMSTRTRDVTPGSHERQVKTLEGELLDVPLGWSLLAPGDAALSRRVNAEGPSWTVKEKRGRKIFSRGIWAPHERIERLRAELAVEREKPEYRRKLDAGRQRRARAEQLYAGDFEAAVLGFLNFDARHLPAARRMAKAVAAHAVPVGSGTVARTQRIPIERRAEAAAIAWMRHQTTAYDDMQIPRVKGMRREVRRMLAQRSRDLLRAYREGRPVSEASCPLLRALARVANDGPSTRLAVAPAGGVASR